MFKKRAGLQEARYSKLKSEAEVAKECHNHNIEWLLFAKHFHTHTHLQWLDGEMDERADGHHPLTSAANERKSHTKDIDLI